MAGDNDEEAAAEVKRQRSVWVTWGNFTLSVSFCCLVLFYYKLHTQRQGGHKRDDHDDGVFVRHLFFYFFFPSLFYLFLFIFVALNLKITKPLKLSPRVRLLFDVAFALFSFGFAYFKRDDVWFVLLGFAVSHHIIPVFNILGGFGNFTALDAAQGVLIQAAALVSCVHHTYAPLVAAIISLALLLIKCSYYYKKQQQQQQHSEEELPQTSDNIV